MWAISTNFKPVCFYCEIISLISHLTRTRDKIFSQKNLGAVSGISTKVNRDPVAGVHLWSRNTDQKNRFFAPNLKAKHAFDLIERIQLTSYIESSIRYGAPSLAKLRFNTLPHIKCRLLLCFFLATKSSVHSTITAFKSLKCFVLLPLLICNRTVQCSALWLTSENGNKIAIVLVLLVSSIEAV